MEHVGHCTELQTAFSKQIHLYFSGLLFKKAVERGKLNSDQA